MKKLISFWKQVREKSSDMFTLFRVGIGVKVPTHKLHLKDKADPLKIEGLQNDATDPDKYLTIDSSNIVKYRTGAQVLTDVGGTPLTTEEVQDIVGAMIDGNSETNISVTYDDAGGKINFVSVNTTYSEATSGAQGLMSTAHHDKLDGIESGATADQTQADINGLAITTVGTIGTGTWNADVIASAKLDADTAHLTTVQTFSGQKTFSAGIIQDGDLTITPGDDGVALHIDASDITDGSTSASGTTATFNHVNFENPRVIATNASVTTTNAATVYIKGAPVAGTNQTITNAWALKVAAGNVDISTVTAGTWNGTAIASAYLDADTAHLTTDQTFTGAKQIDKRKFTVTSSTHFEAQGDILYFGLGATTQGDLCYLKEDASWGQADADGAATGDDADRDAMGMLAIALGTDPDVDGMLLRGTVTMDYDLTDVGNPIYVSTTAGNITSTAPSGSGDFVRVVGYCLHDIDGQIWFNPDNAWVEIA